MKQLMPLTGLRGVAAYSVLIAHGISTAFFYQGINLFQPVASRLAYFGMSLFFVLSGFVIHYNYANLIRSEGLISGGYQFMVARFARLYPLYGLMIIFTLDGIPSGYFHNKQWGELAYLTLTQSWFNLQSITFAPAWSISTEWFFYIAFIFFLPLFETIRKPMFTYCFFLVITFLFLPNLIRFQINLLNNADGWVSYFSPFTRIFDFIAGILTSILYLSRGGVQRKMGLFGFVGMLLCLGWCAVIIAINPFSSGKYSILNSNFIYVPAIAPLLFFCCRFDTFLSRILCSRPLIFIGEISYSVYLLGFLIMTAVTGFYVVQKATPMAYFNSCIKIIIIITFTTFIAFGSYILFEKPARTWMRKMLTFKKKQEDIEIIPEIIPTVYQQEG